MDIADLEKLAADPAFAVHAEYLASDLRVLLPQLSDPARAEAAIGTLQKWAAEDGEGLRKQFASAFIEKAKMALGGMPASSAISRFSKPFVPGGAMKQGAVAGRFGNHPVPKVNGGNAHPNHQAPAPRVQAESEPHGRLNPPAQGPQDMPHPADAAHRSGARLAGITAKHGFGLGLSAAAGVGAAHTLSDKQRKERSTASHARWDRVKRGAGAPAMAKMFGVHDLPGVAIPGVHQPDNKPVRIMKCKTCGKPMMKCDGTDGLSKDANGNPGGGRAVELPDTEAVCPECGQRTDANAIVPWRKDMAPLGAAGVKTRWPTKPVRVPQGAT